ncbi:MAG: SsrA-binding protein SmpB [Planctomycetia bacterium]
MASPKQKKNSKSDVSDTDRVIVCTNRRARHEYDVLDELDCGMVLTGSEVKSVRNNKITIEEAYARVDNGEVWLVDCDIAEYAQASIFNHERQRKRKLLMNRREIRKFAEAAENDGLTLVPLAVFFQRGFVKLRLGLCKGRRQHDKRERMKEASDRREMRSARMKFRPR